jgi:hypothetical protein
MSMARRQTLTIDKLRALTHSMARERGNMDGDCKSVRFTPTACAEGVRNELGANWSVSVLNCDGGCTGFWQRILEDIARTYDVAFPHGAHAQAAR